MTPDQYTFPNNSDTREAEAKRIEARRRFLTRSAAGGTGLLIITFVHQRSFAQAFDPNPLPGATDRPPLDPHPLPETTVRPPFDPHPLPVTTVRPPFDPHPVPVTPRSPPGILVSSALMCASLHGTAMGTQTVLDSVSGQLVTRVLCVRQ